MRAPKRDNAPVTPPTAPLFDAPPPRALPRAVPQVLAELRHALRCGDPLHDRIEVERVAVRDALAHLERLTDPTPRSRASNPDTSRAAAVRVAAAQGAQHRMILRMLVEPGTAREIALRTAAAWWQPDAILLKDHQVGRRLIELERAGEIARTATVRDGMHVYARVQPSAPAATTGGTP